MSKKDAAAKEKVRVICRVRPQNQKEISIGGFSCTKTTTDSIEVTTEDGVYNFSFDSVFGPESTQVEIFENSVVPIVGDVLNGYNATVFACTHCLILKISAAMI